MSPTPQQDPDDAAVDAAVAALRGLHGWDEPARWRDCPICSWRAYAEPPDVQSSDPERFQRWPCPVVCPLCGTRYPDDELEEWSPR
jgi:hypothetical protein